MVGPPETPHPMSCGAHDVRAPPVIEKTPAPTDGRGWQAAYFGLAFTPRDWWVGLAGETAGPAPAVNCDEEDLQRSWERAGTVATRITGPPKWDYLLHGNHKVHEIKLAYPNFQSRVLHRHRATTIYKDTMALLLYITL